MAKHAVSRSRGAFRPSFAWSLHPRSQEGAGKAGYRLAPAVRCAKMERKITAQRQSLGLTCAVVGRLMPCSPGTCCLDSHGLGAAGAMDQVHHSSDRHLDGFSIFDLHGRSWPTDGYGQPFRTADGRADITIQAAPNIEGDSPAALLAKKRIQYKRVTPRFFAVSSYKGDKVWYDRCNFSGQLIHGVLINYPAEEEHAWHNIVTRMSLSLSGR
ncbi:hypothetical protein ABIC03_001634 [Bradyrhizobium sp. RT6a]